MAMFTVDHKAAGGAFEKLPIQEYECIISSVKVSKATGGREGTGVTKGCDQLELQMTIRQDIDQPGQKRKFFDNITFYASLGWKVQQFFKACNFEDGTNFDSVEDIARAVAYRSIRVKNKHVNDKDRVDFYTVSHNPMDPAAAGAAGGGGFDPFAAGSSAPVASNDDDDVPF